MVVGGKTLINAVWANLIRSGGGKIFDGQCVPPTACKVPHTPL